MGRLKKSEEFAKDMLKRYSYAHLCRRMRHEQVKPSEKTQIALHIVGKDLTKPVNIDNSKHDHYTKVTELVRRFNDIPVQSD